MRTERETQIPAAVERLVDATEEGLERLFHRPRQLTFEMVALIVALSAPESKQTATVGVQAADGKG